jgi:hypothetical protein
MENGEGVQARRFARARRKVRYQSDSSPDAQPRDLISNWLRQAQVQKRWSAFCRGAQTFSAPIGCHRAKQSLDNGHYLPTHLRRLALPGRNDRFFFAPIHQSVDEFTHRQRAGIECFIDAGVKSRADGRGSGTFRARKSIQQLRLARLPRNAPLVAKHEQPRQLS